MADEPSAIAQLNVSLVADLLKKTPTYVNGDSFPLHRACDTGNVEITKLILEHGALVNALDKENNTPLYIACKANHFQVIKLLVDYNCDLKIDPSPLPFVVQRFEILQFLIESGMSTGLLEALKEAATAGVEKSLFYLVNLVPNVDEMEVFEWICASPNVDLVRHYLTVKKVKPNENSLKIAITARHCNVLELLVDYCNFDLNTVFATTLSYEMNVLHMACYMRYFSLTRALIEKHNMSLSVNSACEANKPPLYFALTGNFEHDCDLSSYLLEIEVKNEARYYDPIPAHRICNNCYEKLIEHCEVFDSECFINLTNNKENDVYICCDDEELESIAHAQQTSNLIQLFFDENKTLDDDWDEFIELVHMCLDYNTNNHVSNFYKLWLRFKDELLEANYDFLIAIMEHDNYTNYFSGNTHIMRILYQLNYSGKIITYPHAEVLHEALMAHAIDVNKYIDEKNGNKIILDYLNVMESDFVAIIWLLIRYGACLYWKNNRMESAIDFIQRLNMEDYGLVLKSSQNYLISMFRDPTFLSERQMTLYPFDTLIICADE